MDEKLSYKDFLDRNDTWTVDDRDLCFESQPVFKPMEMTGRSALLRKLWDGLFYQLCGRFLASKPEDGFILLPPCGQNC